MSSASSSAPPGERLETGSGPGHGAEEGGVGGGGDRPRTSGPAARWRRRLSISGRDEWAGPNWKEIMESELRGSADPRSVECGVDGSHISTFLQLLISFFFLKCSFS